MSKVGIDIKVKIWKDGGCWFVYSRKYDICGYGRTRKRAIDMFDMIVKDILKMSIRSNKRQ